MSVYFDTCVVIYLTICLLLDIRRAWHHLDYMKYMKYMDYMNYMNYMNGTNYMLNVLSDALRISQWHGRNSAEEYTVSTIDSTWSRVSDIIYRSQYTIYYKVSIITIVICLRTIPKLISNNCKLYHFHR